ncbi:MAG: autotransporter outer membrane beta-barrel domain-containing protein, partial [Paracoccus sp. (in: a-proteobacteria)]|nr:autotransporter outer membrane beta-barrel domain-containing protein [Paracoccus sp. (in: a-proteobacteria)]
GGAVRVETGLSGDGRVATQGSEAVGIMAQSIGGGGGNGGDSWGGAGGFGPNVTVNATVTVGGFAGNGSHAGTVFMDNRMAVFTRGQQSSAIVAQSIGGGGGNAGSSSGHTGSVAVSGVTVNANVSVGGTGGRASHGNTITLANRGSLRTFGDFSSGIMAQSIGGGGGFGGASNAKAFSIGTADATQIDVNVGIGGSGGGGGDGRAVTLNNYGEIRTSGYQAYGIMAMSVGGGGGTAGAAAVGGSRVIGTGKATVSVGAAIGLAGGSAGHGGEVTVTNDSRIVTSGDDSYAISASSIGGGGGIGGSAKASAEAEYAIGGGIGGFGGGAGNGGAVTVRNLSGGGVETQSARSIGVFAQSVGGSGGSGGAGQSTGNGSTVGVALTLGGFGAGGGNGASVTVANAGQVHTRSDYAHGIMAQSIGGSGGVGGAAGATSSGDTVAIGLTLGGLGGDGGTASRVTVNNSASGIVRTEGNNAYGVFAQSVGGGGGAAGAGSTTGGGGSVGVNLALGGIGGAGNSGGAVNVDNAGRIETAGDLSHGIFAQSIGGGGGASGAAANASEAKTSIGIQSGLGAGGGAHGGNVTVDNGGDIGTSGDGAHGIFAQSIGGGGGYGGVVSDASAGDNAFAVSVGGIGAGGGDGGDVLVNVSGSIVTRGERAHGVVAQSVGGSGGYGGDAKGKAGGQLAIGGSGGSGGDGGDVTVIRTGQIITLGKDSVAIMAQSVAGGGGVGGAGFGRFTTSDDGSGPNSIGFQIPSGSTGQGGIVRIVQSGQVHTFGNRGHGIVAQAVAGGGGMGGSTSLAAGQSGAGSAGGVGDAQAAEATANDQVNVRGAQSYALFGQSAAGRGNAAAVTLTAQSNLFAQGDGSVAVYGESTASGAKGDITINLNGAYTIGGAQNGAAVMLVGGAQNTVTNRGLLYAMGHDFDYIDATDLIGVVNPTPGLAPLNAVLGSLFDDFSPLSISGTGGNDQIINQRSAETLGRVIGNVDLGGGVNAFHNRANASMIGLQSINLGGGLYTNDGLYSNQGVGIVASVEVGGGFTQIATGTFVTDIDLDTQTNDHVALTGAGDFAGVAPLNFTSIDRVMGDYTLARGASMTLSGLTPTYRPTVGFDFRTRVDNGTDLVLYADKPTLKSLTNDPGAGVTDNGAVQMAQYLDGLEGVMSPADAPSELARMINMLRMSPDLPTFGETMMRLTPHYAVHTYEMVSRSADTALDAAGSCRRSPATAQTGNCFWFNGIPDSEYQRDPGEGAAFRDDAFRQISIGATRAIDDRWTLGATVARTSFDSSLSFQDELLSETRGRSTQVHALAKYSDGPYFADFALGYGRGKFTGSRDTSMAPVEFIPGETLAGDYLPALLHDGIGNSVTYSQNVKQVNLSTRLGYTFQYDQGYYLKPNVRLDGRWIRAKGEETGSVAALRFDGPLLRDPRL